MHIRSGVIRKGIKALITTFKRRSTALDGNTQRYLINFLEGKGRIRDHSAWWFRSCTQKPTTKEVDLILSAYLQFLVIV